MDNLRCKIKTKGEHKRDSTYKSLKAIEEYNSPILHVLGVPFGGPIEGRDSDGESFHAKTIIGMNKGDSVPVTYYHGFGPDDPDEWQEIPVFIGKAVYSEQDERGYWFDVRLDTEEPLAQRILVDTATARASSGAVSHLARMGKAGLIDVWPIGELALFETNEWKQPANDYAVVELKEPEITIPKAEAKAEKANPAKLEKEGDKKLTIEVKSIMTEKKEGPESEVVEQPVIVPEVDVEALFAKMDEKFDAKMSKLDEMLTAKSAPMVSKVIGKMDKRDEVDEFLHWAATGDKSRGYKAALQEGSATEGGYLVPDDFYGNIVAKRDELSIMRQMGAQIWYAKGKTVSVPIENAAVSPARVAEEGSTNESEPTFDNVDITIHRVNNMIKISMELDEDEQANLSPFLTNHVARQFGLWENDAFFVGTGSSEPEGVFVGGTAALTSDYATTIASSEVPELFYKLAGEYRASPQAAWAMKDSTAALIQGLTGDNFQFVPTPQGQLQQALWSKPFYTSAKIAAHTAALKSIVFGDFHYYMIAERKALTLFRNPYLYEASGQISLTWTTRVGGAVLQAEAFQYMTAHS